MNKTKIVLGYFLSLIIAEVLILFSPTSKADYFFDAKIGRSHPRKFAPDFEGTVKDSAQFSIAIGKYFSNNFSLTFNIDYNPSFREHSDSIGVTGKHFTHDDKISSLTTMINVEYYLINIGRVFYPYIIIGAGVARNIVGTRTIMREQKFFKTVHSSTTTNFSWKIGGGFLINLNEKISLNFEYKYEDRGIIKAGQTAQLWNGRIIHPSTLNRTKFCTRTFLIGVRYKL